MRTTRNLMLGAAALVASTSLALAQDGTLEMPEQMTEDPVVTADTANHYALLEPGDNAGEATGAAWFFIDPQNNTINWTIEYEGIEPITAEIVCGDDDAAAVTLTEDEMASPIEGEAAVDATAFAAIDNGECAVVLAADEDGGQIRGDIFNATMGEGGM